jgi:hypothetical protein
MSNKFYIEEQWIADYKLSGNDLLIFARLASFTLNVGGYNGSIEWLGKSIGTAKRTTIDIIARLEKRGLIERGGGMIKCVFQPLSRGEKSAPNGAEIAPKSADFAGAEIAPKSAKSAKKSAESAPKYNKENNYTNKCSDSVIVEATTHTLTHTENFLFDFFKSKIQSATDESCIRNLAKKFANIEQAKLFAEFCEERKTNLHLGMITKLFNEIFDRACEWDAQGRPRKTQKQPEQPPQPTPQILPQRENAEISANEAEIYDFNLWRGQIIDCIKNNPKFAKKTLMQMMRITTQVTDQFPTPCDLEKINEYLNAI